MLRLAGGIIKDVESRILLLHRNTATRQQWEIPGGKIEEGEKPEEEARREIEEELGIVVTIDECLGEEVFVEDNISMHYIWFSVVVVSGLPVLKEPETFDAIKYFSLSELRERGDLSPNTRNFVNRFK